MIPPICKRLITLTISLFCLFAAGTSGVEGSMQGPPSPFSAGNYDTFQNDGIYVYYDIIYGDIPANQTDYYTEGEYFGCAYAITQYWGVGAGDWEGGFNSFPSLPYPLISDNAGSYYALASSYLTYSYEFSGQAMATFAFYAGWYEALGLACQYGD